MKSKYIRIALLITIMATLLFTKQAVADTSTYELSSSSGVWSSVVGGDDTVTGVGTQEIRWGEAPYGGQKSGLHFNGVGTQSFNEGEVFLLGTLTHMNWPVYPPTATGATLTITLQFNSPDISPNPQFNFSLTIDETTNEDHEYQCADWHTPGNPPCDDMITFPNTYGSESFQIGDKLYTLHIVGFVDEYPNGDIVQQFITREEADNVAYLVGTLSSVLVAEPDIIITKKTNDTDVESAPGPYLNVGDEVTWQYIVQNTGNVALSDISVVDDQEGVVTCPHTSLEAGELMTCTAITGEVVAGQYTNIVTASGSPESGDPVSDSDTSYYYGLTPSLSLVKSADKDSYSEVGEIITYTFTVENTGDATLTDVVVNDLLTGSVDLAVTPSTLESSDIGTASATYTVTQADIDAGQVLNTATATGKDPGGGTVTDQDDETVNGPSSNPSILLVKEANVESFSDKGEVIIYTFTITNTGNVTLTDVVIDDPLTGSIDLAVSPSTLTPGDSGSATATYTTTQADVDAGQVENTATATGKDPSGGTVSDQDDELVDGPASNPTISLVKTADVESFSDKGEIITYTFTVTNTGNVTLTNVVINDPLTGSVDMAVSPSTLAPNQSGSTTATYTTTQADVDNGQVDNTATATGYDPDDNPVSDQDSESVDGPASNPSISLVKTADIASFSDKGEIITYTFTVTNTGNVTLTDVVIDDPLTGSVDLAVSPSTLAPGDSGSASATYTTTQVDVDNGKVDNTATATGYDPGDIPVSDQDDESVDGPASDPSISLVKTADPQAYLDAGDIITYTFTVTNMGNVTLTDIVINDPLTGSVDLVVSPSTLAPGASGSATATYTTTQADVDNGQVDNTATATGYDPDDNPVSDQDDETIEGPKQEPDITLAKTADVESFSSEGETITYTFNVTNTGNVTLTDVVINDPLTGSVDLAVSPSTLAPNQSGSATATYTTTQTDVDAGQVDNTASATGYDPDNNPVYDQDDETVEGPVPDPSISLVKEADIESFSAKDETITYTFTVTNTGNVTLSDIVINDPLTGSVDLSISPSSLAPGASGSAAATYTTTQADVDAGQVDNTATATGKDPDGDPVYDQDDELVDGPASDPSISLVKTADIESFNSKNETITYTFNVTNTGNVTLSDIVIDDLLTGSSNLSISPSSLAPGESGSATATYTTTQADVDNGQVDNTATATGYDPDDNPVSDQDSESVDGPASNPSISLVKTADIASFSDKGEIITYTFNVTNTGNVTLTDVVIDDPLTGSVDLAVSPSTLAPGDSGSASATYTTTQVDVDNGKVDNTATATGYDPGDIPVSDQDDESVDGPASDPSISLVKTADPQAYLDAGDIITYTFTVTNMGNVTLTDIVINDPLTGSVDLVVSPSTLAPGASGSATATYTTTQADVDNGKVDNTATATGYDPDDNPVSDQDDETIEGPKQEPDITLAKTADVESFSSEGETITYTFTVTNTGNVTLTNVVIDDPLTGSVDLAVSPSTLAPGDSGSASATYTTTQADVDNGQVDNTATATGYDPDNSPVSDQDDETVDGPASDPGISLVKTADPQAYLGVGDIITYTFNVTNTGNVTLTDLVIDDPLTGSVDLAVSPSTLAPGESGSATATYTTAQADVDNGQVDNTATATGYDPDDNPVYDQDNETIEGPVSDPSISLVKTADPQAFLGAGETITYTFSVTNTGNVTLTNVVIDDPLTGSVNLAVSPSTLAPGASGSATATYTTTQADVDNGQLFNTATATGYDPDDNPVFDQDDETIEGPKQEPEITLIKTADVQSFSSKGEIITYTFAVTNSGNVTLTNVVIDDPLTGSVDLAVSPSTLAPGASGSATATYTTTQSDVDNGKVDNTATATGYDPGDIPVSDQDDESVDGPASDPSISLVKTADPQAYLDAGDIITYTFTVTNMGNVTLTDIVINDPLTSSVDLAVSPSTLAPGESGSATAAYMITQLDIDHGQVDNTATATGYDPGDNPVSDQDDETIEGPKQEPDITVAKTADVESFSSVGDIITYTFTVTNTGNVTLTNVVIDDPLTGSVDLAVSPSTLAPGDSGSASATYTATQTDIDNGQVDNTATATGYDPDNSPVSDQDDETVDGPAFDPGISLVKTADPQAYLGVGDIITYTFNVTNTGNVTLTDIVVNDPLTGSVDLAVSPSTLAPGESGSATATYTTTQADVDNGQVDNTATATGYDPGDNPVYDQDDETIEGPKQEPEITLTKTADPEVYLTVGDVITYTFSVENTGNITISNLVIDDPLTGSVDLPVSPSTLAPGEIGLASATYIITQTDVDDGQVVNTATATGEAPGGDPVEDDDDEIVEGPKQAPDITLVKSASPDVFLTVGEEITYTFTVTNTGNVTLTDVVINDPLTETVDLSVSPSTLAPNEVGTASVTYTTTQADVDEGQIINIATATGEDPNGDPVEDEDEATVEGPKQSPDINLIKTADPQTFSEAGEIITYTFTVTNTGNVTLTDVVINDPLTDTVDLAVSPSTLEPGESGTATVTYTITAADVDAGTVTNTATATGTNDGENYSDTDTETISFDGDKGYDPTPDKPSGGNDSSLLIFFEKITQWLCKLGFSFEQCD